MRLVQLRNAEALVFSSLQNTSACFDICALLGYYAALSRNSVPTFRYNLSLPYSRVKKSKKKIGPLGCPETSVQNYHSTLRNNAEERRSHLHLGGSLKCRKVLALLCKFVQLL
jgi:hypothetical protein